MSKVRGPKKNLRHAPLEDDLQSNKSRIKVKKVRERPSEEDDDNEESAEIPDFSDDFEASTSYRTDKKTKKKLQGEAKRQMQEIREESAQIRASSLRKKNDKIAPVVEEDDDFSDGSFSDDNYEDNNDDDDDLVDITRDEGVNAKFSESEEQLVQSFLSGSRSDNRTVADCIMSKIREQMEGHEGDDANDSSSDKASQLPDKVVQVYTSVGVFLSHYRAGKIPKALKMLPHLRDWEEILDLTNPMGWTPHATYACTRIFASNLNDKLAQKFYSSVLLEKVLTDISANRHLNYHLYAALKKAMYKPAAFFKGILLPLADSGSCSLREALIVGSVLTHVSVPMNHAAAALIRLCEMDYSGSTSIFLRLLISKRYSFPSSVINAVCAYFQRFLDDDRALPVIWHQSLLVFVQRYKHSFDADQVVMIRDLMRKHCHHSITTEIRKEMFESRSVSSTDDVPDHAMPII